MPRKAKQFQGKVEKIDRAYLAVSHNEHAMWFQPCQRLDEARAIAWRMLAAGAHMAIVIDVASHRILFDASRPDEHQARGAEPLH